MQGVVEPPITTKSTGPINKLNIKLFYLLSPILFQNGSLVCFFLSHVIFLVYLHSVKSFKLLNRFR